MMHLRLFNRKIGELHYDHVIRDEQQVPVFMAQFSNFRKMEYSSAHDKNCPLQQSPTPVTTLLECEVHPHCYIFSQTSNLIELDDTVLFEIGPRELLMGYINSSHICERDN